MKTKTESRRVRYAVVGLGHIAQIAVLPAFAHARRNSELAALVSDTPAKLEKLSKKYRVSRVYSYAKYAECLESGAVDAVYIALPNHMHRDYAVAAARAGIHVLCEKPMALTEKDCEEMIEAACEHRVRLMIAYRLHFEKANLTAIETVRSGKIGEPRIFSSDFTLQVEDEDNIRLRAETGGGPLWDIGVYCINAARSLFREEPIEVFAFSASSEDKRFRETDEMTSVVMRFPRARLATFTCSFGASAVASFRVIGTRGEVRCDNAYEYAEPITLAVRVGERTREREFPRRDQFAPELLYFSDCVLQGKRPEPSGREGLADVRIVRALLESARTSKPVRLDDFERRARPGLKQEIHRPPVEKPELVGVEGASGDD